jgi:hypothetical protein
MRFQAETSRYLCDHEIAPRIAVRRRLARTTVSADFQLPSELQGEWVAESPSALSC